MLSTPTCGVQAASLSPRILLRPHTHTQANLHPHNRHPHRRIQHHTPRAVACEALEALQPLGGNMSPIQPLSTEAFTATRSSQQPTSSLPDPDQPPQQLVWSQTPPPHGLVSQSPHWGAFKQCLLLAASAIVGAPMLLLLDVAESATVAVHQLQHWAAAMRPTRAAAAPGTQWQACRDPCSQMHEHQQQQQQQPQQQQLQQQPQQLQQHVLTQQGRLVQHSPRQHQASSANSTGPLLGLWPPWLFMALTVAPLGLLAVPFCRQAAAAPLWLLAGSLISQSYLNLVLVMLARVQGGSHTQPTAASQRIAPVPRTAGLPATAAAAAKCFVWLQIAGDTLRCACLCSVAWVLLAAATAPGSAAAGAWQGLTAAVQASLSLVGSGPAAPAAAAVFLQALVQALFGPICAMVLCVTSAAVYGLGVLDRFQPILGNTVVAA